MLKFIVLDNFFSSFFAFVLLLSFVWGLWHTCKRMCVVGLLFFLCFPSFVVVLLLFLYFTSFVSFFANDNLCLTLISPSLSIWDHSRTNGGRRRIDECSSKQGWMLLWPIPALFLLSGMLIRIIWFLAFMYCVNSGHLHITNTYG